MAMRYLLPLACSCSSSPCNAPVSSSGIVGGALLSDFSDGMDVLPVFAPSRSFVKVGGREAEVSGGFGTQVWGWSSIQRSRDPERRRWRSSSGISAYRAQLSARVTAVEAIEPPQGVLIQEVINAEVREEVPELGGGDGGKGKDGGRGGGGGGDGGGEGEGEESGQPMSTAQKLTLGYAALVGVGGLIGFYKSGSNKSLIAGGASALALFLVFSLLPSHPTFASFFGLGISAVLLGVMYPRFKKSGKFMPAGLVALVSLVMTGGYLHGIVRTAH